MRELRVVGFMPSSCAAPFSPATLHPVASRASIGCAAQALLILWPCAPVWPSLPMTGLRLPIDSSAFRQGAIEIEPSIAGRDHATLYNVLQFAHVTGPAIGFQPAEAIFGKRLDRSSHSLGKFSGKSRRRAGDIVAPLAQRRHVDREHVEPIVEILAELALARSPARDRGWSRR